MVSRPRGKGSGTAKPLVSFFSFLPLPYLPLFLTPFPFSYIVSSQVVSPHTACNRYDGERPYCRSEQGNAAGRITWEHKAHVFFFALPFSFLFVLPRFPGPPFRIVRLHCLQIPGERSMQAGCGQKIGMKKGFFFFLFFLFFFSHPSLLMILYTSTPSEMARHRSRPTMPGMLR